MNFFSISKLEESVSKNPRNLISWIAVIFLCFGTYIHLSNEYIGQNLHVWTDEIIYSMESRNLDLHQATYPVFLYLWLFSFAHLPDDGFLELARHFNALFIVISLPFLFLMAKSVAPTRWALVITVFVALSPITTYSAYFMPDAMFFAVFIIYAWFCVTGFRHGSAIYGAGVGILAATLTLIKPHGLFLFVAFQVTQCLYFFIYKSAESRSNWLRIALLSLASFAIVRVGLAWALGAPFVFLGSYGVWSTSGWTLESYLSLINMAVLLTKWHFFALAVLLGPCILAIFSPVNRSVNNGNINFLRVFVICNFLLMFAVAIMFSVRISVGASTPDAVRLHMRYYNFIFPLFYLLLVANANTSTRMPRWMWGLALLLASGAVAVVFGALDSANALTLDAPELHGLFANKFLLQSAGFLSAVTILLFLWRPAYGAKLYMMTLLPVITISAWMYLSHSLNTRAVDTVGDRAGKTMRAYLGNHTTRIGYFGEINSISQAQFYSGGPGSRVVVLQDGTPVPDLDAKIDADAFTPRWRANFNWLVVFGKRAVPEKFKISFQSDGWALYKRIKGESIGPAIELSDINWLLGFSRKDPMFFVKNSNLARTAYVPGYILQFADGQTRKIIAVSANTDYLHVVFDGLALDGQAVGFPRNIEVFN